MFCLFILVFFVAVFGIALVISGIVIKNTSMIISAIIMLIISVPINIILINTDPNRALNSRTIAVEYARVNDVSEKTITLDDVEYEKTSYSKIVEDKYPIDLTKYSIGDIVQCQYILTDLNRYLIKVEKVK